MVSNRPRAWEDPEPTDCDKCGSRIYYGDPYFEIDDPAKGAVWDYCEECGKK